MNLKWKLTQKPSDLTITRLSKELGVKLPFPESLANILVQRGIQSYDEAKSFFVPDKERLHDPLLMRDLAFAVKRLLHARESGEKILLIGDYDVDGTTAVALCALCLGSWGFRIDYYIPDRYREGYGVSFKAVDYAEQINASLLISLDCGIKAHDKVEYAREKNMEFIICDHHTPGERLPNAYAILDPKRRDCHYPFKELSGCGVAWKLMEALYGELIQMNLVDAHTCPAPFDEYCDLITLSIASDIVPIIGENRIIAYHGLKKIRNRPLPGIQAIMALNERQRSWNISDLVFFIGPRVNAAGRIRHASHAVDVLLGNISTLSELAQALHLANEERQDIDRNMTAEALEKISQDAFFSHRHTTVLYDPKWHKGVVGIVASRLIEYHYRPTVLLAESDGKLVGSARSVEGFNLYEALADCEDCLLRFGGHQYAAGLTMERNRLEEFQRKFDRAVSRRILPEQKVPTLYIDHIISFSEIDDRFIRLIYRMAPFGPGNPTPVFASQKVSVIYHEILKDQHLKVVLEQNGYKFEAIGFNIADKLELLHGGYVDVVFQAGFNIWKDQKRINLILKDIKSHGNLILQPSLS